MALLTDIEFKPGDRVIPVSTSVEKQFGRCAAKLLQQVHFWCTAKPCREDGVAWVYNTYEAWSEQIGYSARQVRRVSTELKDKGVLIVANHNKTKYDRTLWYRVDYDALAKAVATCICPKMPHGRGQNGHMDVDKMATPIPEMNTKMNHQDFASPTQEQEQASTPEEPSGVTNAMNAKEILELKALKEQKKVRLPMLWQKNCAEGSFHKALTGKQAGQLKMFEKAWGDKAAPALVYCLHYWPRFASEAKAAYALGATPVYPDIGFMLKYGDVLMNLYVQSIAEPSTVEPKIAEVKPKQAPVKEPIEEVYVPSDADFQNALSLLG